MAKRAKSQPYTPGEGMSVAAAAADPKFLAVPIPKPANYVGSAGFGWDEWTGVARRKKDFMPRPPEPPV